eukprot:147881-Amphidinium_carterae.1
MCGVWSDGALLLNAFGAEATQERHVLSKLSGSRQLQCDCLRRLLRLEFCAHLHLPAGIALGEGCVAPSEAKPELFGRGLAAVSLRVFCASLQTSTEFLQQRCCSPLKVSHWVYIDDEQMRELRTGTAAMSCDDLAARVPTVIEATGALRQTLRSLEALPLQSLRILL